MHGFALNVDPGLRFFDGIIPCGIRDRGVTSIRCLLGESPDLDVVARIVAQELARALDRRLVWQEHASTLEPFLDSGYANWLSARAEIDGPAGNTNVLSREMV